MENIRKGFPQVPQSVTNPNVKSDFALDRNEALSFIEFIKVTKENFEPNTLQDFYTYYLNEWNNRNNNKSKSNRELIIDQYRSFLKELSLVYSNETEKKFLSVIDFGNPDDLAIAISFFSKKLREITSYYRDKRKDLSVSITKNQTKGSNFNLKKRATEVIINFLENREDSKIAYDVESIRKNINVNLTEYFDSYTSYFNQKPNVEEFGKHFKSYDPDKLPSDNIFLQGDKILVQEVFYGFTAELKAILQASELFESKRTLTEKYIGTDFYYISSNSTGDFVYEKLFEAESPYTDFLNQAYPSTASVFANTIETEREAGYFKSSNTGISVIRANAIDFTLKGSYEPDSLFIFPDPSIFTNNQNILAFNIEPAEFFKNLTSGAAKLQPLTNADDTSYLGYSSKFFKRTEDTDLAFLFDRGYIADAKKDLYNNIFGLLKDSNYYRDNLTVIDNKKIKSLIFNGYQFYDFLYYQGYSFDYSIVDSTTYTETKRSGITSFTNGLTTIGDNTPQLPSSAYNIFFRYFDPYQELKSPIDISNTDLMKPNVETAGVKDGAFFVKNCGEMLPDPVSSDLSAFSNSASQFYFSELIEAGIAGISGADTPADWTTIQRALSDTTVPTASGTFFVNLLLSSLDDDYTRLEGGRFTDTLLFEYTPQVESYYYDNTVLTGTTLTTNTSSAESRFNADRASGTIYVKNATTGVGTDLFTGVTYLSSRYSSNIKTDLSARVINFDLLYDTLFVETSSFFVIEPLRFEDGKFEDPFTNNVSLSINTDNYDKLSNRFEKDTQVYYYRLKGLTSTTDTKALSVYPELYRYDYIDKKSTKLFPKNNAQLTSNREIFSLSSLDVIYKESDSPVLTYRRDVDLFNLSFLLKDQNKSPYLINYIININSNDDVVFLRNDNLRAVFDNRTFTFENNARALSSFNFNLSSTPLRNADNSLIL